MAVITPLPVSEPETEILKLFVLQEEPLTGEPFTSENSISKEPKLVGYLFWEETDNDANIDNK